IAMGSLREVQALVDLIEQNGLIELADQVAAHLYKLIQNPGTWSRSCLPDCQFASFQNCLLFCSHI
ncbi:MAG: hypothetical protein HY843_08595, partial [Bdellovibrio sp.]|nr:hypothetical protein [Bdellovibrio sp.]